VQRDFSALRAGPFDVLVVGGGVYGSWIAYDAALRGLRVALIERGDWACGTSSASSKLIHGGLRYLEQRRWALVRGALGERRRLTTLAPHRVRPLRFAIPRYRGDRPGRLQLALGLWLYDRFAGRGQTVGRHRTLSADKLARRYPFLRRQGLKVGFTYGDCVTDDARLVLELVDGALAVGAAAVNRAGAKALLTEAGRVVGAVVRDEEAGETIEVRAAIVVNCTGPWCNALIEQVDPSRRLALRLTKGVHLLMPPLPSPDALLISSAADRRIVFVIPWYGRTLLGTTDTDHSGSPSDARVELRDIDYLLGVAKAALLPNWTRDDVLGAFAGVRTLRADDGSPSSLSREWSLEEPLPRLLTPIGGKYTSARADAALVVDRVLRDLGRPSRACATAERKLPWAPDAEFHAWSRRCLHAGLAAGLDEEVAATAIERYGRRFDDLLELVELDPTLARRIVPAAPFCLADVVLAATQEMARTLEDVLRRRLPLLLLGPLPPAVLATVAELVGRRLGWTDPRIREEIASVERGEAAGPLARRAVNV
jgi:glycerol-3-phosphate dehydrogenase